MSLCLGGDIYQLQIQMSQLKNPSDPKEVYKGLFLYLMIFMIFNHSTNKILILSLILY